MGIVDNTLFIKIKDSHLIIIQIYVDAIIFWSTYQSLCDEFSKLMHDALEMSMMGELSFLLGLQIKQMHDIIFFNQSKYIGEMLEKFGLENSKVTKPLMSRKIVLILDKDNESIDSTKYRGMICSLLYLTASRPDIMFSVCLCVRFQEDPKVSHLEAVKEYLDHAGDVVDRKSTSGIYTFDDESFPEEDVLKENFKIYSNPLFEFDDEYISSDCNHLFFIEGVRRKSERRDLMFHNLDEQALIVTPLSDANEDECFDPGGDEIEACLTSDSIHQLHFEGLKVIKSFIPPDFEDDYFDSEGDTIFLKSLLINGTIPNLPLGVFFDHDPKSLNDELDNDDLKNMIKDCPDYEDSRARGFVHRSLKLQSLACLYMGIRYPRSY
ncbi:retrovirus-related pol polyprotein from transposon TNT 1-94 [Tanacetum coccineum]